MAGRHLKGTPRIAFVRGRRPHLERESIMKSLVISALMILAAFAGTKMGQTEKRITFAKGKSSAVVKGNTGQHGSYYVVRAKQGQMLTLDVSPAARVGVMVETNGRYGHSVLLHEEHGGRFEIGLEEAGDYTIFIGSLNGKPVTFNMTVSIRKLADI